MTIDWFNISLWLFALLAGIVLLILSNRKGYIDWVKERIPMSDERIMRMEKVGAIGLMTISVFNLIAAIIKH